MVNIISMLYLAFGGKKGEERSKEGKMLEQHFSNFTWEVGSKAGSHLVGLGWGRRICISTGLPDDAQLGTTLGL